jgi:hypothetical protein
MHIQERRGKKMSKTPWKNALLLLIIFELAFMGLTVLMNMKDSTFPILDMTIIYNFDTFKRGVSIDSVRVYYSLFRLLDMFFPIVYASFFITIADKKSYVKIAVIMAAIFDYVENLLQIGYLFIEEHVIFEMIILISVTWMKFIWLGITVVLVLYYYLQRYLSKK